MLRGSKLRPHDSDTKLDLTPMLDVVFIMLIFFIVSTTFIKRSGAKIERSPAFTSEVQSGNYILLGLTKQDQLWFNRHKISIDELRASIEPSIRDMGSSLVVIQADRDSSAHKLLDVLEQVKQAGAKSIKVATSSNQ